MYDLSFQWERCPDGVELHDYGAGREPRSDAERTLIGGALIRRRRWFRFRSERRDKFRLDISDLQDPVILRFLNANDDEARARFFSDYGFLSELDTEIEREDVKEQQHQLFVLLQSAGSGSPMVAIKAVNHAISSHAKFAPHPVLDLAGNAKRPRLALQPQSLLGFMLMEAAMVAAVDARTASCKHCGDVILTGTSTGRRSTAQFCSDRCRVAAMRVRKAGQD